MDSKEGVWKTIPVLFHSADHQKAMVTAIWKETAAAALSLKPATLPTPSPMEGQRDAPDSAQAAAFVSTQGKVRGSSRRPGRPPQGLPSPGSRGRQHHGTAEQRLSRLGGKTAHGDKPAVPEPCSPPRTGVTHSHQSVPSAPCCALPWMSQGRVFGTAFPRLYKSPTWALLGV